MTIGQRLRREMARAGLTQKEVARRAGLQKATVSDVVNDRSHPTFDTVARMVVAIGTTFGELFDEPRIQFSYEDAEDVRNFHGLLQRLLENDSAQKAVAQTHVSVRAPRQRRHARSSTATAATHSIAPSVSRIRDAPPPRRIENNEVENLPNEIIPEPYYRDGARRAFRVLTDAMIGDGILQGAVIYTRSTLDLAAADGEVIMCLLNGTLYLKRLDLRGRQKTLVSANPRYPVLYVEDGDEFTLLGVVVVKSAP